MNRGLDTYKNMPNLKLIVKMIIKYNPSVNNDEIMIIYDLIFRSDSEVLALLIDTMKKYCEEYGNKPKKLQQIIEHFLNLLFTRKYVIKELENKNIATEGADKDEKRGI